MSNRQSVTRNDDEKAGVDGEEIASNSSPSPQKPKLMSNQYSDEVPKVVTSKNLSISKE